MVTLFILFESVTRFWLCVSSGICESRQLCCSQKVDLLDSPRISRNEKRFRSDKSDHALTASKLALYVIQIPPRIFTRQFLVFNLIMFFIQGKKIPFRTI